MTFVLNELVEGDVIAPSKLNENFEGLQGDITNNFAYLSGNIGTLSATVAGVQSEIANKADKYMPTGAVIWYAGNSVPTGYLYCNGSAVSRTTYADLFAVIGTTFGAGDGSTTFNLPNLVDKWIKGSGTVGTELEAGLPNITGNLGGTMKMYSAQNTGVFAWNEEGRTDYQGDDETRGHVIFDASLSNPIYGNSDTVQPPSLTLRPIIKY